MQPHAHYRLREARGEATLPDGTDARRSSPSGTGTSAGSTSTASRRRCGCRRERRCRCITPTTTPPANPRNPERPPKRARWGQRSSDEMGDLWIQVLTRDETDLARLESGLPPQGRRGRRARLRGGDREASGRRRPARRCGAALSGAGACRRSDRALHDARCALKPQSAAAHYNLGTALTVARRLGEAARIATARRLRLDPAYANAHNNLGNVYLAEGSSRPRFTSSPRRRGCSRSRRRG